MADGPPVPGDGGNSPSREQPDQPSGVSSVSQSRSAKTRGKVGRASRPQTAFDATLVRPDNRLTLSLSIKVTPQQIAALGPSRADAFMRGIARVIVANGTQAGRARSEESDTDG